MDLPPGYRLRAPAIEDGPAIADMLNEETVALTGVPLASVEWVTTAWTAPGARLDRDFGVITDKGGAIAGYFLIEFEPPHTTVSVIAAVALSTTTAESGRPSSQRSSGAAGSWPPVTTTSPFGSGRWRASRGWRRC